MTHLTIGFQAPTATKVNLREIFDRFQATPLDIHPLKNPRETLHSVEVPVSRVTDFVSYLDKVPIISDLHGLTPQGRVDLPVFLERNGLAPAP